MDTVDAATRSRNMAAIPSRHTKPELALRSRLHRAGYRFRVHDRRLPGTPDIVLAKYRTVIEVRGCFWHRHPGCRYATTPKTRTEFWQSKFAANTARDARNLAALEADGWQVVVVWECELKRDADGVMERVEGALKSRIVDM